MLNIDDEEIKDLIDPCEGIVPVNIDVEKIELDAKAYACSLVDNLYKFYYNDRFMREHPAFAKRVESDIDALCILIKMRQIDCATQDSLVTAISGNSSNASLYKSLCETQKTILSIQTKIDEIVKNLSTMMKGYQMELDFEHPISDDSGDSSMEEDEEELDVSTSRGSKDFITKMREGLD